MRKNRECREKFTIFYQNASLFSSNSSGSWIKVDTVADSGQQTKKFVLNVKQNAVVVAFHDEGSCSQIQQVRGIITK